MQNRQPALRSERAKPMTDQQYADFHEAAKAEFGLEAKQAQALKNGSSLMVASLVEPGHSVPYKDFVEQVQERKV